MIVVDNIMMTDARNSGTFLEAQRQNKKNPGLEEPRRSILRPKGKWKIWMNPVLSISKKFFGQEPHSWQLQIL